MKSILIGISAPINNASRDAVSVIAEEFNLAHINLRQPALAMVAALNNVHPAHLNFACSPYQLIDDLGVSIDELETALALQLRTYNPRFFIQRASAAIKAGSKGMHNELFNGNLVSGIKTEAEAQWIRDEGGLVVHLHQYDNTAGFHALREKECDLVCSITTNTPTRNNMPGTVTAIQERLNQIKKAA